MAVAVQLDSEGATFEQYDRVLKKMDLNHRGPMVPGGLFHWVMKTENGIRVTDVWESRETFEKFAGEQIGPFTEAVGMNPPVIQVFEVYNYLTAG